jgi:hypothetical protein
MTTAEPLFNRWGHVVAPTEAAGVYVLIESESPEGWKKAPPADAIRVWQRKPGVPDDHDLNWTTWLHRADLSAWMTGKGYVIDEWLSEGVEPDWMSA